MFKNKLKKNDKTTALAANFANMGKLGVFTVAMMNVAASVNVHGLPTEAVYGLGSIFYYMFGALFFLIPIGLSSAEMGSMYSDKKGGVFRWVGEAMGARAGFLAIYLQWFEAVILFPILLTFAGVSLAFIGTDTAFDTRLSSNLYYIMAVILVTFWTATFANFVGIKSSSAISKWGAILGTIIPTAVLIALALAYYFKGYTPQMSLDPKTILPDITDIDTLALAVNVFLFYAGMEMTSVHVKDMKNPQRNYPRAMFLSMFISMAVLMLGTLSIAMVVPADKINLTQSLLVTFHDVFNLFNIKIAASIVSIMIAFGAFAQAFPCRVSLSSL